MSEVMEKVEPASVVQMEQAETLVRYRNVKKHLAIRSF